MAFGVFISLGSFGADEVRRHGQLFFVRLSKAAGADGVEVRGELLRDAATELPALADEIRELGLQVVYSSPEPLWSADGSLAVDALERAIDAAHVLSAPRMKMSIGGFGATPSSTFAALSRQLEAARVELVIENDQTVSAGTLASLKAFFAAAYDAGVPLGMTFDMGNWHYAGECPLQAAQAFAPGVVYVHTKGVFRRPDKWVAVTLAESAAPWRAVLRQMPRDVPWAIEYPLMGDDLVAATRAQVDFLRACAVSA